MMYYLFNSNRKLDLEAACSNQAGSVSTRIWKRKELFLQQGHLFWSHQVMEKTMRYESLMDRTSFLFSGTKLYPQTAGVSQLHSN